MFTLCVCVCMFTIYIYVFNNTTTKLPLFTAKIIKTILTDTKALAQSRM